MRRLAIPFILLAILLALAACGGGAKESPTSAPAQPAAPTQAPSTGTGPATEPPKPATPAPVAATKAPGPTSVPTETEALPVPKPSALKSYVVKTELKSEVTEPEPGLETWSMIEATYRLDPPPLAYHIRIVDKTGQARPEVEMIVIGQDVYIKDPDKNTWMKLPTSGAFGDMLQSVVSPEEVAQSTPNDIFTNANVVSRNEVVDGVATTHYRATEAQLRTLIEKSQAEARQQGKVISAAADFWVARKGNYLKQYRIETTYQESDGRQIKSLVQMLISNENKPVTIEPPAVAETIEMGDLPTTKEVETPSSSTEVPVELAALPAPPQSEEYQANDVSGGVKFIAQMLAAENPIRLFLSDASIEEIKVFYNQEMPKRGYRLIIEMPGGDKMFVSSYKKGDQTAVIQIGEDADSGRRFVIIYMP